MYFDLTASLGSSLVGFGASGVLDALAGWVGSGAQWLLDQVGAALVANSAIDLGAPWFSAHYETMAALSGVVILPLLLLGVIQAIYRQRAGDLIKTVCVHLPLALLLTAVAVALVRLGLAVTDALSSAVSDGAGSDVAHVTSTIAEALASPAQAASPTPGMVAFLGGVVVVMAALGVWIELVLRAAALYVAVLMLPLVLAALVWPAIAHWCRRLVDTLVALVLSKFVIVAVLSLGAGALASSGSPNGGGFSTVLSGSAVLLLAAFSPFVLFRLLPFIEAGAVSHLETTTRRVGQWASMPLRGAADVALRSATSSAATSAIEVMGDVGPVVTPQPSRGAGSSPMVAAQRTPGERAESSPASSFSDSGVPSWAVHVPATEAAQGRPTERSGASALVGTTPLPSPSGAPTRDGLGRDALGPRLVSVVIAPAAEMEER